MKIRLIHILTLFAVVAIAHSAAVVLGLYDVTQFAVDGPLHALGGIGLALLWIWIMGPNPDGPLQARRAGIHAIAIMSFALFGSFVWEILEYVLWRALPGVTRAYRLYSPTVEDLLSDLFFGLLGGLIVGIIFYIKTRDVE